MAEKLNDFPRNNSGRPNIYPWDEWLDGSIWFIKKGEDYDSLTSTMRQGIFNMSYRRGGRSRTMVDGDTITFQFLKDD